MSPALFVFGCSFLSPGSQTDTTLRHIQAAQRGYRISTVNYTAPLSSDRHYISIHKCTMGRSQSQTMDTERSS
ncbi:hypothetical protein BKA62DRAFT_696237 [Auriculariales sp. MPI-PUGE-AT-0066]|nr:hypothetical protein BKA62DRAFT_696237 [Auriculariales sp. MPI-PUGE-AT-0066]